jgi:hypothetical protein
MKTTFWKLYYRWKFKDQYKTRIKHAQMLGNAINESSEGNLSHFYNYHGEQIRGWHRKRPAFARSDEHPLATYYKNL